MLIRLAIFAVFGPLATVGILTTTKGTPLSTPKQGVAEQNSGQNGGIKTKPQDNKSTTQNPPPPLAVQQPSAPPCDEICQQGRQNLDIQGKLKTFTGWLVVVGLLQALALFGTVVIGIRQEQILREARKEIHTQAQHMSRQADLMEKNNEVGLAAANAAQESAKAANDQIEMMKEKERARLQVTPLDFDAVDPAEPNKIMIEFVNIGPTNAFDVRVEAGAKVTVDGLKPEQGEYTDLAVPTLLKPEKAESSWVVWDFPRRWRDEVVDDRAKMIFEVVGQIKYRDVFETTHIEDFSYRMNVYGIEDMPRNSVKLKLMRKWHPFDLHPGEWEF